MSTVHSVINGDPRGPTIRLPVCQAESWQIIRPLSHCHSNLLLLDQKEPQEARCGQARPERER